MPSNRLLFLFPQAQFVRSTMSAPSASAAVLAQYVVVRADLMKKLGWNVGSVVAQAVHAAVASVHVSYGEEDTKKYLQVRSPENIYFRFFL